MKKSIRFFKKGNPLDILIAEEQLTCKGCIHKDKIWGVEFCAKPGSKFRPAKRRCKDYVDENEKKRSVDPLTTNTL